MSEIPIEEYFKYHPVVTEERKAAHNAINEAALALANAIDASVADCDCKNMAFFAVQQARMFANQGAAVDELKEIEASKD